MINNMILMFLCHLPKQLLNNVVFAALIIFLTLKYFVNLLKYMIIII